MLVLCCWCQVSAFHLKPSSSTLKHLLTSKHIDSLINHRGASAQNLWPQVLEMWPSNHFAGWHSLQDVLVVLVPAAAPLAFLLAPVEWEPPGLRPLTCGWSITPNVLETPATSRLLTKPDGQQPVGLLTKPDVFMHACTELSMVGSWSGGFWVLLQLKLRIIIPKSKNRKMS